MLLAAFLVSLAAFFSKSSSVQNRQQEIGGIRREIGGIRREIGGISRKQVSACRVSAFFLAGFSAEISAAGVFRQKVLPPEGPGITLESLPGSNLAHFALRLRPLARTAVPDSPTCPLHFLNFPRPNRFCPYPRTSRALFCPVWSPRGKPLDRFHDRSLCLFQRHLRHLRCKETGQKACTKNLRCPPKTMSTIWRRPSQDAHLHET